MEKLFYEDEEGEFYWVKETPKTIIIDWVEHLQSDGTPLDQNVRWKNLKAKKVQTHIGGHPIKQNDEDGILIYPFQAGQPFYLKPATKEAIESEIADCKKWGVSNKYYQDLMQFIN